MQYPHAQAKVFDLDGHARLLTYLLGGSWHDLGSPTLRFQPLRYVDDPLRRGIALQWLLDLVAEFGVPLTAGTHAFLSAGLSRLAMLPAHERTLSRLLVGMADHTRHVEMSANSGRIDAQGISHPDMDLKALAVLQLRIRQTLHQFALGGEYDGIFDGTVDVLGQHPCKRLSCGACSSARAWSARCSAMSSRKSSARCARTRPCFSSSMTRR